MVGVKGVVGSGVGGLGVVAVRLHQVVGGGGGIGVVVSRARVKGVVGSRGGGGQGAGGGQGWGV